MTIQKQYFSLLIILAFVVLIQSCQHAPNKAQENGLAIIIELNKHKYCLDDDIHVKVTLKNIGQNAMLIDETWSLLPGNDWSPELSTGYLELLDSFDNPLPVSVRISVPLVNKEDFVVFVPGEIIEKNIIIRDIHRAEPVSYYYQFEEGKKFKISVAYQNKLITTLQEGGDEISSWVGVISASTFFSIDMESCGR